MQPMLLQPVRQWQRRLQKKSLDSMLSLLAFCCDSTPVMPTMRCRALPAPDSTVSGLARSIISQIPGGCPTGTPAARRASQLVSISRDALNMESPSEPSVPATNCPRLGPSAGSTAKSAAVASLPASLLPDKHAAEGATEGEVTDPVALLPHHIGGRLPPHSSTQRKC